ncbi:MAG: DMT family transporter, partial [Ignavibacteria bacterium]
ILFALAETKLESSLTGILNALSPLFTLLIGVYVFRYRIRFIQVLGIIIGFIGTLGLCFVNSTGGIGSMNLYVWLVVIATICYGISLNFIKAYLSGISSLIITSLAIFSIGPFALIYLFSTDFLFILKNHPGASASLGYLSLLGVFGTAVGLWLYTRLVMMTTPFFASIVTYMIPVVAIFWGLLDNESLYPLHIAGMILILLGIYIINKSENIKHKF